MEYLALASSIMGVLMMAGGLYDRLFGGLSIRLKAMEDKAVQFDLAMRDLRAHVELKESQSAHILDQRLLPLQAAITQLSESVNRLQTILEKRTDR